MISCVLLGIVYLNYGFTKDIVFCNLPSKEMKNEEIILKNNVLSQIKRHDDIVHDVWHCHFLSILAETKLKERHRYFKLKLN